MPSLISFLHDDTPRFGRLDDAVVTDLTELFAGRFATLSDAGEWRAEQTSVGAEPPYKATMHFGRTAGGAHTAVGSTLSSIGESTAFNRRRVHNARRRPEDSWS